MAALDDARFMMRALALARIHLGTTGSNPSVGCVIVAPDGETILGEGVTARGGRPHAEPQALAQAGALARGATAYVTLEPCSHFGKTPPCADALVAAGVARVVVCLQDPDMRVSGRGLERLRAAGIAVETGLMEAEGRRLLAGYLTRKLLGRPRVILKLAVSADGLIGRRGEGQVAITGPQSRGAVHRLRAECDAILIGIGTAAADDPLLNVRLDGLEDRSPLRLVLDRHLTLAPESQLARTATAIPTCVVALPHARARKPEAARALEARGVRIIEAEDLQALLTHLAEEGISTVMVEGGAAVARAFLDADLVDRILLFESDKRIGPVGVDTPLRTHDLAERFALVQEERFGLDRARDFERIR
ncbi:diaminohydroxyphosphoribosylaminopyrimidine deaminase [Xaviernesmea oryzae]|nr:diaminohydroxyphosphoribosylaminopyrimidine deaminase [Xaviernesmea oryzae]